MAGAPIIYLTNVTLTMRLATAPPPGTQFQAEVSSAAIVPEAGDEQSVVTLDYIRHARYGPPTYALALTVQQNWQPASLCNFLWTNRGQLVSFALTLSSVAAASTTNPVMIGNALARPAQFGGEVDNWIEGEVEMPIDGEPALSTTGSLLLKGWEDLHKRALAADIRQHYYAVPDLGELVAEPAEEAEPEAEPVAA